MRNRQPPCPNLNHRRRAVMIRHCPDCGAELSAGIAVSPCSGEHHAQQRRRRSTYCVDCGGRLRQ